VSGLFHRDHGPWAWPCPCDVVSSIALSPFGGRRVLDSQAYSMLRVGCTAFAFDARVRDSLARKVTVVLDFVCVRKYTRSRNAALLHNANTMAGLRFEVLYSSGLEQCGLCMESQ
jgi:hypothetical protein